jgi:hypothetical protein
VGSGAATGSAVTGVLTVVSIGLMGAKIEVSGVIMLVVVVEVVLVVVVLVVVVFVFVVEELVALELLSVSMIVVSSPAVGVVGLMVRSVAGIMVFAGTITPPGGGVGVGVGGSGAGLVKNSLPLKK